MIDLLNGLLFLSFSVALVFALADIRLGRIPKRNLYLGCAVFAVIISANVVGILKLGLVEYSRLFPLFLYLPGYGFFYIISKYKRVKLLFAYLTAILISGLPLLLTVIVRVFLFTGIIELLMTRITLYAIFTLVVFIWYRRPLNYLLENNDEGYSLFCLIPLFLLATNYAMYHFDFSEAVDLRSIVSRLTLNLVAHTSYLLVFTVFRHNLDRNKIQNDQNVMKLQLDAIKQQIDRLKEMETQAQIYHHDMRHHFALIGAYLSDGKIEKAQSYIAEAAKNIGGFTPVHYCGNETVNLIISYYIARARHVDVSIEVNVNIPEKLSLTDTELCSILSNGLENAIKAAAEAHNGEYIRLIGKMQGSKLLLRIQNPFAACVEFDGELPKAANGGHGLGIKSIVSIANKYRGIYSFSVENGLFTFSLIV